MPRGRVQELKYLIEIPIPYVDKHGRTLNERRRSPWRRKLEVWVTLAEKGQVVLRSACADREAFLQHRDRLVDLVVRMGEDLNQANVFILAYPSDSLLIELVDEHPKHP